MLDHVLQIHEFPEDGHISLLLHVDQEPLLSLGERINEPFEEAYMTGDNWGAVIHHFLALNDPELLDALEPDPEAGTYVAVMNHSAENLSAMHRVADHIRALLRDKTALMAFLETHRDAIPWD